MSALSIASSHRFACCSATLAVLGVIAIASLVVALSSWPTPTLTENTMQVAFDTEWGAASPQERQHVQDSLHCCGFLSQDDRYVASPALSTAGARAHTHTGVVGCGLWVLT